MGLILQGPLHRVKTKLFISLNDGTLSFNLFETVVGKLNQTTNKSTNSGVHTALGCSSDGSDHQSSAELQRNSVI